MLGDDSELFTTPLDQEDYSCSWDDTDTLLYPPSHDDANHNVTASSLPSSCCGAMGTLSNSLATPNPSPPRDDGVAGLERQGSLAETFVKDKDIIASFSEMQAVLNRLTQSLPSTENVLAEVEDLYKAAGALSKLKESMDADCKSTGPAILLLTSCYMMAVQAYGALIKRLRHDLQHIPPEGGVNLMSPDDQTRRTPTFAVGSVCVSLSRSASLHVNLTLAIHSLRDLRQAMQQCISRSVTTMAGAEASLSLSD